MQIKGHGAKLPHKQERAIVALIAAGTVEKAAEQISVSPSTLYRWMQDKDFKNSYRNAKSDLVTHAITRLQQISSESAETLREIMQDKEKPASARVTAARAILDTAIKAVEYENLLVRIEKIEKLVANNRGQT
jgi:DNA-binding MurR/RpiR family transcriptional regulator